MVRRPRTNQSSAWCWARALAAGRAGEDSRSGHSIPNNGHERSWGAPGGRFCELSLGIMECFTEAESRTILAVVSAQVRG